VNGPVEVVGVGDGLVGQMMGFEIAPEGLGVVEFGRVLGQPFDGEPMGAASAVMVALLTRIGPLSSTMTTGLTGRPGRGPPKAFELPGAADGCKTPGVSVLGAR
jgi:hypothetical protein